MKEKQNQVAALLCGASAATLFRRRPVCGEFLMQAPAMHPPAPRLAALRLASLRLASLR